HRSIMCLALFVDTKDVTLIRYIPLDNISPDRFLRLLLADFPEGHNSRVGGNIRKVGADNSVRVVAENVPNLIPDVGKPWRDIVVRVLKPMKIASAIDS